MIVAICDNDTKAQQFISHRLEEIARKLEVPLGVRIYDTADKLLFSLDEPSGSPDIVFFDVLPPHYDGSELASGLKAHHFDGAMIYYCSTDRYVFDAFDVGAYNYLLKADDFWSQRRFDRVVTAALRSVQKRRCKYLLLNGISDHLSIPVDSIRYFEIRRHICVVHYDQDQTFELISTLAKVENRLLAYGFVRIHRSYVVNCGFVHSYTFKSCTLTSGETLPVGRTYSARLLEAMPAQAAEQIGRDGAGEER